MTCDLLYRKVWFATDLTRYFSYVILGFFILSYRCAPVTKVLLILRYLTQTITGKMKTSVTHVTVKNLIRIRIKTTETYLTVSLKKLLACRLSSFCGFYLFHIIQELLNHFMCFVSCPMNYVPEYCGMHQV